MSEQILRQALPVYAKDTENPELNYWLANIYWSMGQTAAAVSFYLRAGERTNIPDLTYECTIKVALAFERQGNRNNSVRRMLQRALSMLPKRPEAYFLMARNYERNGEYVDAYVYAQMGLENCDFNVKPLREYVDYPGRYGLLFERAVSGWYWGREDESRQTFFSLIDEYDNMEQQHIDSVQNNIMSLGVGPKTQSFKPYDKSKAKDLRFKFNGYELIENNFSQVYQDMFVLSCLDGKKNGTYLEIGGGKPWHGNNTALLEKLGWRGVSIEFRQDFVEQYNAERKNKALCVDALTVNYRKLLKEIAVDGVVDYLQLDCEPPKVTFQILTMIPFEFYKFAVITFEHDHYADVERVHRARSRAYLESMGYKMMVNDISPDGVSNFEDWWYHPDLVTPEVVEKMLCNDGKTKDAELYMLGKV